MKKKRTQTAAPGPLACQGQLNRLKARIFDLGFVAKGSIAERYLPCGNPACACHGDPEKRHGPYFQLSWKDKAKTRSFFFTKEHLPIFRQWIKNRKTLTDLIAQMEAVSLKAATHLRATAKANTKPRKAK